jgi:hypothetical protein
MKKVLYSLFAGLSVMLAGCFDITEEIFLEKNGSGSYVSTIDMSQMKDMVSMLKTMMPDSLQGQNDEMKELNELDSVQNMWKDIEQIQGISQVKREKKENLVYVISFRFANIKALNEAMTKRNKKDSGDLTVPGDFYSFKPGLFSCNDTSFGGLSELTKGMNASGADNDSTAMAMNMMKTFMGDMKYTSIYHFPAKVTSFTNKEAKLDADGKTLRLELNLIDTEKPGTLRNEVRFK